RSLKGEDDILTVNLERALELLTQPKRTRKGGRGSKKPLRELGIHPEDKEVINLYEGPYGLYIKHGKVNASLPEGEKVDTLTLETALELLATKATTKKKTTRKSTKSKTTSKNVKSTADSKNK
ncbi:MAG: topoisomerase C-terminal repeat-containing protein, partial [cyanobacterium endosymbiont of Rhopalodia inflata]